MLFISALSYTLVMSCLLGVLQPACSQTGGEGHGPLHHPGGWWATVRVHHFCQCLSPWPGTVAKAALQWQGEACGELYIGDGMPRAVGAVGCHGPLPVGPGLWVNEASWGPAQLAGGSRCLCLKLLILGSTNGVPDSTPGREVQAAGDRGGSLAGKPDKEETGLPPGRRCSGELWPSSCCIGSQAQKSQSIQAVLPTAMQVCARRGWGRHQGSRAFCLS